MDRALDDVISDRQAVEADADAEAAAALKTSRETAEAAYKIRVENLHYDLTEEDIYELFERIGPVDNARLLYDRSDRSEGVAFVTYRSLADARVACREFDGANAHGQPIRLTLVPPGPARRNPFDTVQRPSRSLFDRIEGGAPRNRSLSPERLTRHSDVSKPPPAGIDRYVPGEDDGRRRSPPPRRRGGGGRESGRRPGARREPGRGGRKTDEPGRPATQGRPRKTVEELDAEMADYFGGGGEDDAARPQASNGASDAGAAPANAGHVADDDIDMVE
ncbi:rna binding domain-containing protein [Neofusicoccum parvum]|uniref:Rna binding domain-containing protein n=2 Tax=Neofusicoccum parvum TaxID=310453 RepID=A0ACB5S861_9PEZI|nr:putative rna binding domain-containing protein [Neofusicoccum parvum UCRNP2]GME28856.1 rna binding domain-containing protein [Neofusicoccum parvum]GME64509.1 rna binding domain-containing protein [Neofusicoccum parvum]